MVQLQSLKNGCHVQCSWLVWQIPWTPVQMGTGAICIRLAVYDDALGTRLRSGKVQNSRTLTTLIRDAAVCQHPTPSYICSADLGSVRILPARRGRKRASAVLGRRRWITACKLNLLYLKFPNEVMLLWSWVATFIWLTGMETNSNPHCVLTAWMMDVTLSPATPLDTTTIWSVYLFQTVPQHWWTLESDWLGG